MTIRYELHLIASTRGATGPDRTARLLGTYATELAAHRAGLAYLAQHPDAWLQVQDAEQRANGVDVVAS